MKSQIQLLSQGAYGCVYRPGINCKGNTENKKYITKIQKSDESSQREIDIGIFIRKNIKNYTQMYAPIIKSCPVNLAKIKDSEIEKCEVISKNKNQYKTPTYIANKIKYVGKDTLAQYMLDTFNEIEDITPFFAKMFEGHLYLLKSVEGLSKKSIIHFDIKENNIIYNENTDQPIIIDFGLSFRVNQLKTPESYVDAFYVYYEKYPPWCLEIVMISYIVQNEENWTTKVIDISILKSIMNDFFNKNDIINSIAYYSPKKVEESKRKWEDYITKKFNNKTGIQIVEELVKSWATWDKYALSVIFIFVLNDMELMKKNDSCITNTFMGKYQNLLFDDILELPDKRMPISNIIKEIKSMITNIGISDLKKVVQMATKKRTEKEHNKSYKKQEKDELHDDKIYGGRRRRPKKEKKTVDSK